MRIFLICAFVFLSTQLHSQSGNQSIDDVFNQPISRQQFLADLDILQTGLEKLHAGLYRYTSADRFDSLFEETRNEANENLLYAEVYRKVCALLASIKCNHTVATPNTETYSRIQKSGKFFPLRVHWEFDPVNAYAAFDFSSDANLPPGTKIKTINGQSIEEIYSFLISFLPADGDILSGKQSRLQYGIEFQIWYYLLVDRPEFFEVELVNAQQEVFKKSYAAVTLKQWTKNYKRFVSQKDPQIKKYVAHWINVEQNNNANPIRVEFPTDETALLTVLNFDKHDFEKRIGVCFAEIKAKRAKNLIIDVRYNGGGSDILGRDLFKFLIQNPTAYFDSLYTSTGITDTTFLFAYTDKTREWYDQNATLVDRLPDGRYSTKPEVNKGLLMQEPASDTYSGRVYILMNGRSASTTAEFTAAAHFNKLATFIGEESGGAYHGGNGGDFAFLTLPNSQISVQIPLSRYVMNSKEHRYFGRGTMPDYIVKTTMQDVLDLKDPQLEFALELIQKSSTRQKN